MVMVLAIRSHTLQSCSFSSEISDDLVIKYLVGPTNEKLNIRFLCFAHVQLFNFVVDIITITRTCLDTVQWHIDDCF